MTTHFGAQRLVASNEVRMPPPSSVGSLQDLFKMPHIQLSLERRVLGLTEEHGKKVGELFGIVHLADTPTLYP